MSNDETTVGFLQPLERKTRGEQVLEALAGMIEQAGLGIGDRLPPETVLAERCGVGRSTMREALNRWEGLGIIRRKQGAGTFLTANVGAANGLIPLSIRLEGQALLRMLQVRRALEDKMVRLAAENASAEQRQDIDRKCTRLLEVVAAGGAVRKQDSIFHQAVYDASGNPLFGKILAQLDNALERAPDSPFGLQNFGLASFPIHRELSDAILAGDAEAAALANGRIIDVVEDEIHKLADL